MHANESDSSWKCSRCGETVDADFDLCWNCGATPDGLENPDFVSETASKSTAADKSADQKYTRSAYIFAAVLCVLLTILSITLAIKSSSYTNEMLALFFCITLCGVIGLAFGLIAPIYSPENKAIPGRLEKLRRDLFTNWAVCPNCFTANLSIAHFCRRCATPLTSHAEIDPLGRIYSMGDTYRKACHQPYKLIILIGMWLHFGVQIPFLLMGFWDQFQQLFNPNYYEYGLFGIIDSTTQKHSYFADIAVMLTTLLGIILCLVILFKVTKNYLRLRKQTNVSLADAEHKT
ncbi:hypothetical protein ACFL02_07670 [Planctomycetota bacterium]